MRVARFRSAAGREPSFHPLSAALLADPAAATPAEAERWLDLQGPVCPDLAEAAASWDGDAMVFYPYLYWPTVRVIGRVGVPTILHPAAHDEPALLLPVFPAVFGAADALVFQTEAERHLVESHFPVATHRQLLLGLGVDDPAGRTARTRAAGTAARGQGRRAGAGARRPVSAAASAGSTTTRGRPCSPRTSPATRSAGPGRCASSWPGRWCEAPPPHADIDVVGPVSEADKWDLLDRGDRRGRRRRRGRPSRWWWPRRGAPRTPVLVNAGCARHRRALPPVGGWPALRRVRRVRGGRRPAGRATGVRRRARRARGRAYVDARFRWPVIVDRYAAFVESVGGPAPAGDRRPGGHGRSGRDQRRGLPGSGPEVGHDGHAEDRTPPGATRHTR